MTDFTGTHKNTDFIPLSFFELLLDEMNIPGGLETFNARVAARAETESGSLFRRGEFASGPHYDANTAIQAVIVLAECINKNR